MLSRLKNINQAFLNNVNSMIQNRSYKVQISNTNPMNSSHEQSQRNPIIQVGLKKVIQHPSINIASCEKPECGTKLCDKPCATIKEKVYVGHITHSEQYGKFISYDDLNNKKSPQYFASYNPPVKNHDSTGINTNESRTENLNHQNKDARAMIHIYSSYNPLDE